MVYSPRGNFKAALALAEKFKQAIEGKYARRVEKVREVSRRSGSPHSNSPDASSACSPEEDLVKYNVFVLDASLEEMHDSLAHLVSRVEDVRVDHAFTDGTDAHVHGPGEGAYDADFDMEFVDSMEAASPPSPPSSSSSDEEGLDQLERGMNGSKVDSTTHTPTASSFRVLKPKDKKAQKKEKKKKRTILRANTINFAQREKDEMRDLTQASEILTYYPDGYKVVTSSPVSVSPAMSLVSSQDSSSTPISDSESSTPGSTSNPQAGRNSQFVEEDLISGSSTANYWDPSLGQIYLGNSSDVPLPPNDPLFARRQWRRTRNNNSNLNQHPNPYQLQDGDEDNVFDWRTNDPNIGFGYDICVECDDLAPFPSAVHMRAAEEHVRRLDKAWVEQCLKRHEKDDPDYSARGGGMIPPRPPPHASAVVHLPFPSSVSYTTSLLPFISWLEGMVRPVEAMSVERAREALRPTPRAIVQATSPPNTANGRGVRRASTASGGFVPSSLPPPSSFPTTFLPPATSSSGYTRVRSTSATYLHNAGSSQSHSPSPPSTSNSSPGPRSQGGMQTRPPTPPQSIRTRPLKILIYSADGYTESSSLALCLLMALKGLTLPEAYLELQVEKKRSFFVYQGEVGALKRVEGRLEKERERLGFGFPVGTSGKRPVGQSVSYPSLHSNRVEYSHFFAAGSPLPQMSSWGHAQQQHEYQYSHQHSSSQHCYSNAMSDGHPASAHPLSSSIPNESSMALAHHAQTVPMLSTPTPPATPKRPRASTLPALPSFRDHQAWFNDPRFDGSFPSRVLPFLYLGNL